MKLSDYIAEYIASLGTRHVFCVTGGAITHVVDSIGRRRDTVGDLEYICVEHEQAGAMAAEAYSRLGPGPGVVVVTSGPGATNLITGMCGCWFDSIPALFVSGQVGTKESCAAAETKPRQVGFQETDIVSMVKGITKYAVQITEPSRIRYELEKAWHLACEGRPGPVLLDIPTDLQVADIDPAALERFTPDAAAAGESDAELTRKIDEALMLLKKAVRPVVLLGGGIKIAGAEKEALAFVEKLNIPCVVSWSGFDIMPHTHPQFRGALGVYGRRGANFAVQNADLLLSIGSRLDTRQTGGRLSFFARAAKKIMVDIDETEIKKGRGLVIDLGIRTDAKRFFNTALPKLGAPALPDHAPWREKTRAWYEKYPAVLPEYFEEKEKIISYVFMKRLSDKMGEGEIVITDEGGNLVWTMQSWEVKKDQKIISTFGNSPMGYALPAAIGAAFARPGRHIICIDGDGGFQMNIQELQTVAHYNLPVKIIILNNRSMGIIKQFQDLYFESRRYATDPGGGYSMPDFARVAEAYGIPAFAVKTPAEIDGAVEKLLAHEGPILCDVWVDADQKLNPKLEFGRPLEDMTPYLDREEFRENMIVPPLPESKDIPKVTKWETIK